MIKNQRSDSILQIGKSLWQKVNEADQKSMAPYMWGTKIAKMCSNL
jgi:hypothetical protein